MSQIKYSSFEARLHARINGYGTDVPVFTQAFNRGHTPSNPQVIFRQPAAVLSGGPDRGQTSGFPLRAETHVPAATEIVAPVFSRLFEDPSLITPSVSSDRLINHLQRLSEPLVEGQIVKKAIKLKSQLSTVEIAPDSWKPVPYREISLAQQFTLATKRALVFVADNLFAVASLLLLLTKTILSFFGWLNPLNRSIRLSQIVGRSTLKILNISSLFISQQIFTFTKIMQLSGHKIFKQINGLKLKLRPRLQFRMPQIRLQKNKLLKFEINRIALPKIKMPSTVLPSIRMSQVLLPQINLSKIKVPRINLRNFKLFKIRLSRIKLSKIKLPRIRLQPISFSLPIINFRYLVGGMGKLMIVASIVLFLMTGGPIIRLQLGDWWAQSRIVLTGKANEPAVKEVLTDTVRKPDEVPPVEKQFQLEIPKIGANLRVIPNVDAGDEKAYTAALKLGVAHAAGSGLPGEANTTNRTIYIFGHSTNGVWNIEKYNALFYSLKDLVLGDEVSIWFWGKEFHYKVTNVVKIDPSDLTYLAPQTLKDQLILQTCWPPGTVWKRLLVIAEPVK